MKKTQRLDKALSHMGHGTRSDIRKMVKNKQISVNGKVVKDSGLHISATEDSIQINGEVIIYRELVYLMMNKPQDVISATEDNRDRTVIDLLPESYRGFDLFPVGRLDKDTVGLLLLTNDGKLAHNLLSPRKHVSKTYYAEVDGEVGEADIKAFAQGIRLEEDFITLPANLKILRISVNEDTAISRLSHLSYVEITIQEGKFHQIKRMFQARGQTVIFLKRLTMGTLCLDEALNPGEFRELTEEELAQLLGGRAE